MAELVDAADSKSAGSDIVRVQVPLLVPVGFSEHITDHCLIVLFRTLTQFSIIKKSFFSYLSHVFIFSDVILENIAS